MCLGKLGKCGIQSGKLFWCDRSLSRCFYQHLPPEQHVSSVTGEFVRGAIATSEYWVGHARESVRFALGMKTLHQTGHEVFVEIGAGSNLLALGRECLPEGVGVWLPSLCAGKGDTQEMLESLARLYVRGVAVDWRGFDRDYSRRKVVLPTYPFQRQRWVIDN